MNFKPHITVASIIEKDNRFLLVREHTSRGIAINQPAGHLEADEDLLGAARREALEETGWHVELHALVGLYLYQAPNGVTYLRVCFAGKPLHRDARLQLDEEIIEALWLTQEELAGLQEQHRSPLVMQCLQDYLDGERHPLSMLKGIFRA